MFTNKHLATKIMKRLYAWDLRGWLHLGVHLVVTPFPSNSSGNKKLKLGRSLQDDFAPFTGENKPKVIDLPHVKCPLPPQQEQGLVQSLYGCLCGLQVRYCAICEPSPHSLAFTTESVTAWIQEHYPFMINKGWVDPDEAAPEAET